MSKVNHPVVNKLSIDVVEYAFVEWLVRRKLFDAFKANYDRVPTATRSFRDCLRDHIRLAYRNPSLGPGALISSAFPFISTPEGYKFWRKHSDAWRRFYDKL